MVEYLEETTLLNFSHNEIVRLVEKRNWHNLDDKGKILSAYNFVRDEIKFGYNVDDAIPASKVLSDGYGQCNTKGILFMALLRALKIPCRMHGFTIHKQLQQGAIKGVFYLLAPKEILHSWVEVLYNGNWINLEGFILDIKYLEQLQVKFSECEGSFCGYGISTDNFKNPLVYWSGGDTYIQKEGIERDFGVFTNPDVFFTKYNQSLSPIKQLLFKKIIRRLMNKNVDKIRRGKKG